MSRLARHRALSASLAARDDAEIAALAGAASTEGIGGATGTIEIDGVPVFVKRVPLTARELASPGSTANLFGLPLFYQYGVGSTGFGAWRELAVHTMTTEWVRDGSFDGFPLLHHARVLPYASSPADPAEIDRWTAYWADDPAVRDRLTALAGATSALTLFLEHVPHTLDAWLRHHPDYAWADDALHEAVTFMAAHGLIHFDAHFHNVLTDGERVYLADFGLALHDGFALSPEERAFHREHRDYDRIYTASHLVHWLLTHHLDVPWRDASSWLTAHPDGDGLPPGAAAIVARHREAATLMGGFLRGMVEGDKRAQSLRATAP
ncbi:protein kinase family protein [Catenuloplanes japonicus]|uniref:hypothetical protein n=1 Tax=Catenuloplanes japonicus TaxID=33876 RepID=UPI00068EB793|nr:hypothetical protein [Catenuloplanes japonicus]